MDLGTFMRSRGSILESMRLFKWFKAGGHWPDVGLMSHKQLQRRNLICYCGSLLGLRAGVKSCCNSCKGGRVMY